MFKFSPFNGFSLTLHLGQQTYTIGWHKHDHDGPDEGQYELTKEDFPPYPELIHPNSRGALEVADPRPELDIANGATTTGWVF